MSFLGIDLGTSGIKVVICDKNGDVIASESAPLTVQQPQPLWSEQSPETWWDALCDCMNELAAQGLTSEIESIGIAGQMHGAVLLDSNNVVLRPAILWNDGRCQQECEELMEAVPEAKQITGNLVMPGFTAPKLRWVEKHEPACFAKVAKVLLPKDYLRLLLTGTYFSDMSDAAGTSWLDTKNRCWSIPMLAACNLTEDHMPTLCEGTDITGNLSSTLAEQWKMSPVPVVGGAGDNAAGAIGSGIIDDGQAMLSLGTSGVTFAVTQAFQANPDAALHSFCHAIPNRWHVMSVHLSAASCLQWFANIAAAGQVTTLLDELASASLQVQDSCFFLPYLTGERTPHNNPNLGGEFVGLTAHTTRAQMTYAVLEGVTFAFKDGLQVMADAGVNLTELSVIGGGARSEFWRQLIADVTGIPIIYRLGGEVGPALGAARLAQIGVSPETDIHTICPVPEQVSRHQPTSYTNAVLSKRYAQFVQLGQQANQRTINIEE